MGVHLVAGDQAVEVDHSQQVGALAGVEGLDVGTRTAQAFLLGAETDHLEAVLQGDAAEVAGDLGEHRRARGVIVQALQGRATVVGVVVRAEYKELPAAAGRRGDDVLRTAVAGPGEVLATGLVAEAQARLHQFAGTGEAGGAAIAARVVGDQALQGLPGVFPVLIGVGTQRQRSTSQAYSDS